MKLFLIYGLWPFIFYCQPSPTKAKRNKIRANAIRYINLANNKRWGTFVEATDTLYVGGCLVVFDTVNLIYKQVATVKIFPTTH